MNYLFDEEYYMTSCGLPYNNIQHKLFFERVAECIIRDFHPITVLDAGCAYGYLVAALRDRGVEAYGVDISDYAIAQVRDDIRPFCISGSLTDPLPDELPNKYDLLVNIEILEHLFEDDSLTALSNLCKYSDRIIFSSSADDITEKTHYNVQQIEYWCKHFAKEGFFRILDYDPDYITPQAIFLVRSSIPLYRVVENYEHKLRCNSIAAKKNAEDATNNETSFQELIRQKDEEIYSLRDVINTLQIENRTLYNSIDSLKAEKDVLHTRNDTLEIEKDALYTSISAMQTEKDALYTSISVIQTEKDAQYKAFIVSTSWRITRPLRSVKRFIENIQMRLRKKS